MSDGFEWTYEGHGIWRETTCQSRPYPWIMKASEDPSGSYILFDPLGMRSRHRSFEQAARDYEIRHTE